MNKQKQEFDLSARLKSDGIDSLGAKLRLVAMLTWPAVMAQLSTILMEYIDAAMVGSLGAAPAASIGLVATTTWLFWGLGTATVTGFAVQVAHLVGGGRDDDARAVLRQALVIIPVIGCVLALVGVIIAPYLPVWLGGDSTIIDGSTSYFLVFALSLPPMFVTFLASSMLRCSGNMVVPGIVNVAMCILDVVFNALFIFPSRTIDIFGVEFTLPGAGLGVTGAAIGSLAAVLVAGSYIVWYLLRRSNKLSRPFNGITKKIFISRATVSKAAVISWPIAIERVVMTGAQILITAIVAPLGNAAIAANSFAVTAEALCYMPGYGLSDASTTLVGQSLGAGRRPLALNFSRVTVVLGMIVMGLLGIVMWILAPAMMSFFTPDAEVVSLGTVALRTEAWAEPMFGAAIVVYGVFVGAGYTMVPAIINFSSIWAVRLTLSAILAGSLGLFGVWLAMAIELTVRGSAFLIVFLRRRWLRKALVVHPVESMVADMTVREPDEYEL